MYLFFGSFQTYHPLELAVSFQKYWMRLTTLCHGLLGGLAFGHWLYIISNIYVQDGEFISHYSHFSDTYVSFFYFLCVICLISVFEKYGDHFQLPIDSNVLFLGLILLILRDLNLGVYSILGKVL